MNHLTLVLIKTYGLATVLWLMRKKGDDFKQTLEKKGHIFIFSKVLKYFRVLCSNFINLLLTK